MFLFRSSKFCVGHVLGSVLCTAGLSVIVLADRGASGADGAGSNPLVGDILVMAGACVYAVCNIAQVGVTFVWTWI